MKKVIIIGAGIAGLTCGIYARRSGSAYKTAWNSRRNSDNIEEASAPPLIITGVFNGQRKNGRPQSQK